MNILWENFVVFCFVLSIWKIIMNRKSIYGQPKMISYHLDWVNIWMSNVNNEVVANVFWARNIDAYVSVLLSISISYFQHIIICNNISSLSNFTLVSCIFFLFNKKKAFFRQVFWKARRKKPISYINFVEFFFVYVAVVVRIILSSNCDKRMKYAHIHINNAEKNLSK